MRTDVMKRIDALEQRITPPEQRVLFRTFVTAGPGGPVECEPVGATGANGWRIDREDGESVKAFRERARSLAPRNDLGVTVLCDVLPEGK